MNRHIACILKSLWLFTQFRHSSSSQNEINLPNALGLTRRLEKTSRLDCECRDVMHAAAKCRWVNGIWPLPFALLCVFTITSAQAQVAPCCVAHAGMGCLNQECSDTICQLDPFCCSLAWDERCAMEAGVLCDSCRATSACEVPLADLQELTMCELDVPVLCAAPEDIRTLIPNLKLGGRAWSAQTSRDVDWFEISLDSPQLLSIELWTQGPIGVAILDDQCPPTTLAEGVDGCSSITQVCVPAGITRVIVRSLLFENISCEDDRSLYTIQSSLSPCTLDRLVNDRCDMALPIGAGEIATDTTNATTESTWLPSICDEGAGLAFTHDAWFNFTANASGIFQASTCLTPTFDSRLAVYEDCGGNLLACSDDACEDNGASCEFQLNCGATALIRVGGWGSGGPITLSIAPVSTISCTCPADLDGSGEVDSSDVALCLMELGSQNGLIDLDGDGEVSSGDLALVLLSAGACSSEPMN